MGYRAKPWAVIPVVATMALGVLVLAPRGAEASVFRNGGIWPHNAQGYTRVPVCIISASSAEQKGDGADAGLIHDRNPSLADVISHVRAALASSWERVSSVRFVGWRSCDDLSAAQKAEAVGLFIHPDIGNAAHNGYDQARNGMTPDDAAGVHFKPWGNSFNRCIVYNWNTTHMEYSFACVEQYAIHEFGHTLGFQHEWIHPDTPAACSDYEQEALVTNYSSTFDVGRDYTVVNANYDWDSIMTYDLECAHITGVRFGSENIDEWDVAGVEAVYPIAAVGAHDIGVIPENADDCSTELVTITMDDEDDEGLTNSATGWLGAISQGRNTHFAFCRADGDEFAGLPGAYGDASKEYAVLRLGPACPASADWFYRLFDNEDDGGGINSMSGRTAPNTQFVNGGTNTRLHFCVFRPGMSAQPMTGFPDLGYAYGVFAAGGFAEGVAFGSLHIDDEDDNNANQFVLEAGIDGAAWDAAGRIFTFGRNSDLRLARVETSIGVHTVGTPSAYEPRAADARCEAMVNGVNQGAGGCSGAVASCVFNGATELTLPHGRSTVTVTGVATSGYAKQGVSYVEVVDRTGPHMTCTGPQTVECAGAATHATVQAECSDNCSGTSCQTQCPSEFHRGFNSVGCQATDAAGNASSCQTSVTVRDTIPPTIECPAAQVVECVSGVGHPRPVVPTASDACTTPQTICFIDPVGYPLGRHEFSCLATDGPNDTRCNAVVTVRDTVAPTIACPAQVVVECTGGQKAPAVFAATASDTCDTTAPVATCDRPSGSAFPLGTTPVTCQAADVSANRSKCGTAVTVRDTERPAIACPAPLILECTGKGQAVGTFAATAADKCDGVLAPSCAPVSGSAFKLGTTSGSCAVADASGNAAACSYEVTVADTTPPSIGSATASPDRIWPANHRMVPVTVSVAQSDVCDPAAACHISGVATSEPADGDWTLTGPLSLAVRAERDAHGPGRQYAVTVECGDHSGNTSHATVTVTVPHNN